MGDHGYTSPVRKEQPDPDWSALLVQVANHRDRRAYEQLFRHFTPRLTAYLIKQQANEQQALEVVQETMLTLWQKAHLFNPDKGSASTWLYTIARNVRFDMLRKQKGDISAEDLWPVLAEEVDESQEPTQLRWHDQLRAHCHELPPAQYEVIKRVYLEDKTQQEVAEELAIPLGTVKSRIRLAINRLQQILGVEE